MRAPKKILLALVDPAAPATLPGETPWISGEVLPVQIGVYKRLSVGVMVMYSYWDGDHWLWNCHSAVQAVRESSCNPSLAQGLPWCGLLLPPGEGYGAMPYETAPLEGAPS